MPKAQIVLLSRLKRNVLKIGGSIADNSAFDTADIDLQAPEGHLWRATSTHTLAASWDRSDDTDAVWTIESLIDDVADGVEKCVNDFCEFCQPQRTNDVD